MICLRLPRASQQATLDRCRLLCLASSKCGPDAEAALPALHSSEIFACGNIRSQLSRGDVARLSLDEETHRHRLLSCSPAQISPDAAAVRASYTGRQLSLCISSRIELRWRQGAPALRREFCTHRTTSDGKQEHQASQPEASLQERLSQAGWTRQDVFSLPNCVSLARLASGPAIAAMILHNLWGPAVISLAVAGASDWLDGYLARRLGQGSVLGSYLDPLADKVLICSTVAALGFEGSLPAPLAALIVGRDVALVGGALLYRAHTLGWHHVTLFQFFSLPNSEIAPDTAQSGSRTRDTEAFRGLQRRKRRSSVPTAETVKPLWISKANTVLQLSLVGGCLAHSWLSWPDTHTIWMLSCITGLTTAGSGVAYAQQLWARQSKRTRP